MFQLHVEQNAPLGNFVELVERIENILGGSYKRALAVHPRSNHEGRGFIAR
jgi:hypothetical protein